MNEPECLNLNNIIYLRFQRGGYQAFKHISEKISNTAKLDNLYLELL